MAVKCIEALAWVLGSLVGVAAVLLMLYLIVVVYKGFK